LAGVLHVDRTTEVTMAVNGETFTYAMFRDKDAAEKAVQSLIDAEFATERIGAMMLDDSKVAELPMRHKTGIGPGTALGALLGTAVGLALPGLGLVAAGPAWGALGTAAWGGATGALAGIVGGMGLWKDEYEFPRAAFERGGVLVGAVVTPERADAAKAALSDAGATEVKVASRREAEAELREAGAPGKLP
jgi:hypothetical protein